MGHVSEQDMILLAAMGAFNNYVDKMRGGGGGGVVKKWQNSVHLVVKCSLYSKVKL